MPMPLFLIPPRRFTNCPPLRAGGELLTLERGTARHKPSLFCNLSLLGEKVQTHRHDVPILTESVLPASLMINDNKN